MIERPCSFPNHVACDFQLDRAVGKQGADRVVLDDIAPALAAQLRILDRGLVRRASDAEIDRCEQRNASYRVRTGRERALPLFAEQVVGGYLAILEYHGRSRAVIPSSSRLTVGRSIEGPALLPHRKSRRIPRDE